MLSQGSGRGVGVEPPGARCTPAVACLPLCPALVLGLGLEPGLNLSALGSGPDTLPRGLGHSVPVPPAAGSPRLLGQHRLWPTDHLVPHWRHPPGMGAARAWVTPPTGSGPWVGPRQPRPFGHCGLEAWLPPPPPGQPSRLPVPSLALLVTPGSPEASWAWLPKGGRATESAILSSEGVHLEWRQRGSQQPSSSFQSLPWGPGARMLTRTQPG